MPPAHISTDIDLFDFSKSPPGEVWRTGAGPGDLRLLTLLILHVIRFSDAIVHDVCVEEKVLKRAAAGTIIRNVGKRGAKPSSEQADINALLTVLEHSITTPAFVVVGERAGLRNDFLKTMVRWQ